MYRPSGEPYARPDCAARLAFAPPAGRIGRMSRSKLAFSTNAYTRHPLADALRGIRAAGFDGVEILADEPHAYPPKIDAALVDTVRRTLDETGLAVSNVNCNCSFGYWKDAPPEPYFEPSLISPNPQVPRRPLGDDPQDAGVREGDRRSQHQHHQRPAARRDAAVPKAEKQFAESMKPILDRAEALGVERRDRVRARAVPRIHRRAARLDRPPRLTRGSAPTSTSATASSSARTSREVVEMMRGRIWNLHVEDLPGRKHYHMIPGEGTFDWAALKDALATIGYDRFLTVELYTHTENPQEAAEKSHRFLSRVFGD